MNESVVTFTKELPTMQINNKKAKATNLNSFEVSTFQISVPNINIFINENKNHNYKEQNQKY